MQIFLPFSFFLCFFAYVQGCTDFLLKGTDQSIVNGRSMEFAADLKSTVIFQAANTEVASKTPSGENGLTWTSKYSFIGVSAFDLHVPVDGLNEKGLSFGMLWLPGTIYPPVPNGTNERVLDLILLGNWILSNFETVEQVKAGLNNIQIWAHPVPVLNDIPPLHVALHDHTGKSAVIEFINGAVLWHDNPISILTNAPTFDWHLQNLNTYIDLQPVDIPPQALKNITLVAPGKGTGLLRLPGDYTPPSRFVRAFFLKEYAFTPNNASQGVNLAAHILNTVDIPLGVVRESTHENSQGDYTQWIVIKDLTNKRLYFRSYENLTLKMIDLIRVNFAQNPPAIPINLPDAIQDVTP